MLLCLKCNTTSLYSILMYYERLGSIDICETGTCRREHTDSCLDWAMYMKPNRHIDSGEKSHAISS